MKINLLLFKISDENLLDYTRPMVQGNFPDCAITCFQLLKITNQN